MLCCAGTEATAADGKAHVASDTAEAKHPAKPPAAKRRSHSAKEVKPEAEAEAAPSEPTEYMRNRPR